MSRDSLEILGSKKTIDTSDRRRNDTLERQGNRNRNKNRKKENQKKKNRKKWKCWVGRKKALKIQEREKEREKERERLMRLLKSRMNAAILFRSKRSIKACKSRKRRKTRINKNKKLTNLVREKEDVIKEERKQKNRRTSRRNIIHKIRLRF